MAGLLPRRPAVRDALFASIFALWCVAWSAGQVWILDSAPAFVTRLGDAVPRKMIEFYSPLSYRLTLCAFGTAAFAGMWLLLRLRRWLDPQAQALQALRWALSSRSFNATILFAALVVIGLSLAGPSVESFALSLSAFPDAGRFLAAWGLPIALVAPVVILILSFFLQFNPDTLARDRLERWWRPFWPGVPALIVVVAGWVLVPVAMEQVGPLLSVMLSTTDWMPVGALDIVGYAIELLCDLLVFAFLFSRRSGPGLRDALRRMFRWSTVRAHIGLDVLVIVWLLLIAVPLLSVGMFDAYILPSFEAWRQESGDGAPTLLAAWADVLNRLRGFETPALLLLMPLDLWLRFVLGRLLYRTAFVAPAGGADAPAR